MDLISYSKIWTAGEVKQGKIVLVLGVFLAGICYFIGQHDSVWVNGLLIPFALVNLTIVGFGIFQNIYRPKQLANLTEAFKKAPEKTLEAEVKRVTKEKRNYTIILPIWIVVIIFGIGFYFWTPKLYLQGVAIGIVFLGIAIFIMDAVLQNRSITYLKNISSLLAKNK